MSPDDAIAVFDSGFGGLTVLQAITDLLPKENTFYFADTAHLPYGNKGKETILRYCLENASFLKRQNIKLLVIACNTACCCALEEVRKEICIPVIGITEVAVQEVLTLLPIHRVGILGTRATIASGFYQTELSKKSPSIQLFPLACPLFVPLVEEGYIEHAITDQVIGEYLLPLKRHVLDGLLLGCTHYPLLTPAIRRIVGPDMMLIDPAAACARRVKKLLEEQGLLNQQLEQGRTTFFSTDDPEQFRRIGQSFLKNEIVFSQ
ncbi:MAG: hypothetical protein RLZZ453_574 [Chlamydiota bacterium]|jgi:glutamate racemase